MNLAWYARRLARMSPAEVGWRVRDEVVHRLWRRHHVPDAASDDRAVAAAVTPFASPLPNAAVAAVPAEAGERLVAAADRLLDGHWPVFARERHDMMPAPDWFLDPRTGRRAPASAYCFDIDHRDESRVGNIKYVWEASRHQHITVLAAAWYLTGDERYAATAAAHLRSWWDDNPFLSGVHWTSGIELGIRLLSWVWVRRLLDGWPEVPKLFDDNPVFLRQLHDHQVWLATFPSRGTSANNHLVAELAGQFAASCALPWFPESARWRQHAAEGLRRQAPLQTFPDGLNRELATPYHGLVYELLLAAAVEGEVAGHPLGPPVWDTLRAMTDALAAIVDVRLRPPRQGDDDEGHGLILDAPGYDRWASLLATGARLFGPLDWWPQVPDADVRTSLVTALVPAAPEAPAHGAAGTSAARARPAARPALFPYAGVVVLRDRDGHDDELWCRLDHGPHGFLGIAAHAHADALSLELRVGGVDVLADPGTYCYHGEPVWRAWFRSTRGHNTLEVGGVDQSVGGGPFLWTRHARTWLVRADGLDGGDVAEWEAAHDGYRRLRPPVVHHRRVRLLRPQRRLEIEDVLAGDGTHDCRLSFHLGPDVECTLTGRSAELRWPGTGGGVGRATLDLPEALAWTAVRGSEDPPDGWYSPTFDRKVPATVLIGTGRVTAGERLRTGVHVERRGAATHPGADATAGHVATSTHQRRYGP